MFPGVDFSVISIRNIVNCSEKLCPYVAILSDQRRSRNEIFGEQADTVQDVL